MSSTEELKKTVPTEAEKKEIDALAKIKENKDEDKLFPEETGISEEVGLDTEEAVDDVKDDEEEDGSEEEEEEEEESPVTDTEHQEGKPKRATVIVNGRPVEPNCQWDDKCKKEAVVQFHDTMTQKDQLLCEEHIKEKEHLFKTGNQSYQVTPLITQNKSSTAKKKKKKSKGKK
jgi:hypothetical protein